MLPARKPSIRLGRVAALAVLVSLLLAVSPPAIPAGEHLRAAGNPFTGSPTVQKNAPGESAPAANPFTGAPARKTGDPALSGPTSSKPPPFVGALLARIGRWQMEIRQRLSALVHDFETEGRIAPLLLLVALSFAYGAIHALGPGHGKAVGMAYVLSRGGGFRSGLSLGFLIALVHGASAVALVLTLRFILAHSVSGGLAEVGRVTTIVSYTLITLIGLMLLAASIRGWRRPEKDPVHGAAHPALRRFSGPLAAAVAIGIVPCPGVAMITLFCLSAGQLGLGILLAAAVSAGMALSITLAVWASLAGRHLALRLFGPAGNGWARVEPSLQATSGLLVTVLGGLFTLAAIF